MQSKHNLKFPFPSPLHVNCGAGKNSDEFSTSPLSEMAYGGGRSGGRAIRVLNVAEKPSVAKAVSGFLSKNQQGGLRVRDGRSRYNKIFEFNHTINGQPCHMSFTSVTGHLMELDFDDRFRRWHSCDPVDLYRAPVRKFVPEVFH